MPYAEIIVDAQTGEQTIRPYTPEEIAAVTAVKVPVSITPRQCRLLLLQKGLLGQILAVIEQQNEDVRITWEYALEFRRDDPLINQLAPVLNFTQEMLDQFFIEAAAL